MRNNCLAKKGVSLVTVLIFMMIASIAATATYKWLSSAGFSSADRMAMAEAKEASHAGLESVRSWMTYHANDVGAILRQYYDGGKKPVALTNIVRKGSSSKQIFSVWLTGVETAGSAYKFTIVSNGSAHGDAKYSETSVLNVRGLYKVREPVVLVQKPLEYSQSYFGGTTEGTQSVKNESMIINGNWSGNPPTVTGDFVVTGNASLSGNALNLGRHVCVGGNFSPENKGVNAVDLYVKGESTNFNGIISGNAVFDGKVEIGNAGGDKGSQFAKDVTIKSELKTQVTMPFIVSGNFCVEKKGKINVGGEIQKDFKAKKNVKVNSDDVFVNYPGPSTKTVKLMNLGGSGYSIYMPNLTNCKTQSNYQGCSNGLMGQNYKMFTSAATNVSSPTSKMDCDISIVSYCDSILGKPVKKGCDGSKYKIDDMITTAYDNFSPLASVPSCSQVSATGSFNMDVLNNCYTKTLATTPALMYHGYLVVNVTGSGDNTIFKDPKGKLKGNFIFIMQSKFSMLKFPPTDDKANVFVYMKQGAGTVNTSNEAGKHNYFIYSKANITELHNSSPGKNWDGSFYMTAENCSKIGKLETGNQVLNFNRTLLQNLIDSSVICGFDKDGNCGAPVDVNGGNQNNEGEELNIEAGFDRYYIATAPQLSITLESQRRNKEIPLQNLTSKQYTTVQPSIVMLPRVGYLSNTPKGYLGEYFKVINLNGANEKYSASNVKCNPSLEPSVKLQNQSPLTSSVYKCEYTAKTKSYGTIPFWIVVDAEAAKKSEVSFTTSESRIYGGGSVNVRMDATTEQKASVTATIRVTEVPSGWTVTPLGSVVSGGLDDDGNQLYTVTLKPGTERNVFLVEADAGADNDQINFAIVSTSENARMGAPPSQTVWLMGAATIQRIDIPKTGFCNNSVLSHKVIDGVNCDEVVNRPNCEGNLVVVSAGEWVRPNCSDITTQEFNDKWGCGTANAEGVQLVPRTVSPYCDVFIPDTTIAKLKDGEDYTLMASYKAKLFNLRVIPNGAKTSKVRVDYSKQIIDDFTPTAAIITKECADTCIVPIYAGYNVRLRTRDGVGEKLKMWKFMRTDSIVDSVAEYNPIKVSLMNDTTVIAEFAEIENHCFYADFKDTRIWCDGSTDDCVDKCTRSGKNASCKVDGEGVYPNSKWFVTRTNDNQKYKEPGIQGGAIYYSNGKNANSGNSSITYMLNRIQAGGHGTLMASFKSCSRKWNGNGKLDPLNSGFILRSNNNASDYAIMQIYAREGQKEHSGRYVMEARVCKGNSDGIKNENSGDCKKKEFNIVLADPTAILFNTEIVVEGDSARVKLSYKMNNSWIRSEVKLPVLVSATSDEYVGLSMADDCFQVLNLGWESEDWDDENCYDLPKVGCSFAANYLGGILPVDEDVKPWVGTSSWFNDPLNPEQLRSGCSISYHYNGCDLALGYATNHCEKWDDGSTHCSSCSADSDGPYFVNGIHANTMSSGTYKFTYAGLHGLPKKYDYNGSTIYGTVRDASVVVDCSGSNGNNQYYEASCGRFVVGSINECSQSVSFNLDNCKNKNNCVVNVTGGVANFRSSLIQGEITGLADDDDGSHVVSMVLTDINGLKSQELRISGNGMFSRDVNMMSDMQEFDPEKVVSVEFTSTESFTVSNLSSNCPNSVGIKGCSAELDGDHFVVTGNIVNAGGATCKVEDNGNTYKVSEKNCPVDGRFFVPAVDLQKNLNISGSGRGFSFTITAKSGDGDGAVETCTTPVVYVQPNELTCDLSSTVPVNAGDNLPSINYKITNCPPSGCAVEAKIGSEAPVKLIYRGDGQVSSWSPNVNTTAGNYRYILSYAGLTCTADITVVSGANGSTADNCAIDEENKRFTADLNLAVGNTNTIKLWYLDKLGNIIDRSKNVSPSTTRFSEPLPEMSEAGDYIVVLSINGEEACSVSYTYAGEEPTPDAECYIEGGRFKTRNKNTTGQTMYAVWLNRNTDGSAYGNNVGSGTWEADSYLDLDAYIPQDEGTYTYNLGYSADVLCSVTYKVGGDNTEGN